MDKVEIAKIIPGTNARCLAIVYRTNAAPHERRTAYFQAGSDTEAQQLVEFIMRHVEPADSGQDK